MDCVQFGIYAKSPYIPEKEQEALKKKVQKRIESCVPITVRIEGEDVSESSTLDIFYQALEYHNFQRPGAEVALAFAKKERNDIALSLDDSYMIVLQIKN